LATPRFKKEGGKKKPIELQIFGKKTMQRENYIAKPLKTDPKTPPHKLNKFTQPQNLDHILRKARINIFPILNTKN